MFPAKEENIDIMACWHDGMSDKFVRKAHSQVDTLATKARWHTSMLDSKPSWHEWHARNAVYWTQSHRIQDPSS